MSYGFLAINGASRVQIDQDFQNARMIGSGTLPDGLQWIQMPYWLDNESPIVFIRPSIAESYVGGCMFLRESEGAYYSGGMIHLCGQHTFHYAIFATVNGSAIADNTNHGMLVYRSDGSLAFDSRHTHPQVRQMFLKAQDTSHWGGYPNSYTISGYGSIPWLLANSLPFTYLGQDEYSESLGCVMAKVNSTFTTVTVDFRDVAYGGSDFPVFPDIYDRKAYNPYNYCSGYIGVGNNA